MRHRIRQPTSAPAPCASPSAPVPPSLPPLPALDMSNQGHFLPGQVFRPGPTGVTRVWGPYGSGKTTIANALRDAFVRAWPADSAIPLPLALSMSFPEHWEEWARIDQPWPLLQRWLASGVVPDTAAFLAQMERIVETRVQHLMAPKVHSGRSKFGGVIESSRALRLHIDADTCFHVADAQGRDLGDLFVAHSEVMVLTWASHIALRELLPLDLPLVVDDIADGRIDSTLWTGFLDALCDMAPQVILFSSPRDRHVWMPQTDVQLALDTSGRARIVSGAQGRS